MAYNGYYNNICITVINFEVMLIHILNMVLTVTLFEWLCLQAIDVHQLQLHQSN